MKNKSLKLAPKAALHKTDVSGSLRMLKQQLREAVANYMYSEGLLIAFLDDIHSRSYEHIKSDEGKVDAFLSNL